jgi:hypothetical protein
MSAGKTVLDAFEQDFYAGDRWALFEAIRYSHQADVSIPEWVRRELDAALERYQSGAVRELGAAFGIKRGKNKSLAAIQSREKQIKPGVSRLASVIFGIEAGVARGEKLTPLCVEVGKRFGVSGATAKSWYYEGQKIRKSFSK